MYRILRFTPEAVFNTFATGATNKRYFPVDSSDTFKPAIMREMWATRDPKLNVPRLQGSEVYRVAANWSDRVYWEGPEILTWLNRINPGQTDPWVTDQRKYDLASASIEYGWVDHGLSLYRNRYTGCKVGGSWELSCEQNPSNPFLNFRYEILGSRAYPDPITNGTVASFATAFPEPTESDLPDNPLTFWQSALTWNNAAMLFVDRWSIRGSMAAHSYWHSTRYPSEITHNGRTVTLSVRLRVNAATDPRTLYEARTALNTTKILFTRPGADADTIEISFRANTKLDSLDEEQPIDADGYTTVHATAFLDSGAGDDFYITYTNAP